MEPLNQFAHSVWAIGYAAGLVHNTLVDRGCLRETQEYDFGDGNPIAEDALPVWIGQELARLHGLAADPRTRLTDEIIPPGERTSEEWLADLFTLLGEVAAHTKLIAESASRRNLDPGKPHELCQRLLPYQQRLLALADMAAEERAAERSRLRGQQPQLGHPVPPQRVVEVSESAPSTEAVVMTVREAAKFIGIADKTVRTWIRDGKLWAESFSGGNFKFRMHELEIHRAVKQKR